MNKILCLLAFCCLAFAFNPPSVKVEDGLIKIYANDKFVLAGVKADDCKIIGDMGSNYNYYRDGTMALRDKRIHFSQDGTLYYQNSRLMREAVKIMEAKNCSKCYENGDELIQILSLWKNGYSFNGIAPWMIYGHFVSKNNRGYVKKMNDEQIAYLKKIYDDLLVAYRVYIKQGFEVKYIYENCDKPSEIIVMTNEGDFIYKR